MYHNRNILNACDCNCACIWMCSRFQRKVEAQPVEAGDQQPGVWPAHLVSHVHRREPPGRLGGGPETTAQVRNKHVTRSYPTATVSGPDNYAYCLHWYLVWLLSRCNTLLILFWHSLLQLNLQSPYDCTTICPQKMTEVQRDAFVSNHHISRRSRDSLNRLNSWSL